MKTMIFIYVGVDKITKTMKFKNYDAYLMLR